MTLVDLYSRVRCNRVRVMIEEIRYILSKYSSNRGMGGIRAMPTLPHLLPLLAFLILDQICHKKSTVHCTPIPCYSAVVNKLES